MKIIIQRVKKSSVEIDGVIQGQINKGYMVLVGFKENDNQAIIEKMVDKMLHLRIFEDEQGKLNLSIKDIQGSILSISQFTLYADCRKGRRPGFTDAAKPEKAIPLYNEFNNCIRNNNVHVETGIFGADMKVSLINDGPVTITLDSEEICK